MAKLSHTDEAGKARMVDVGQKDITSRRAAAEAFARSEEKWLAVAANTPMFVCIVDREGRIEYLNRTKSDVPTNRVLGSSIFEFMSRDQHARLP